MTPQYPVYIVSKGRWDSRLTHKALHNMGTPHYMVVEQQEHDAYRAVVGDSATLLILDPKYQRDYDPCMTLKPGQGPGSGPARNYCWEHATEQGAAWHWVIDDNIRDFYRLNRNIKARASDGTVLAIMETFVERYENVAMAGPQYEMFVPRKQRMRPMTLNTRIYSCNLIRNDMPYRWRGRYNEDTDLSLRMLKDGWCTVLFRAFLQEKMATQSLAGGNTDEFYAEEGTLPKSQMLADLHPDVVQVKWRYNRWHHRVDYRGFKRRNRLRLKPGMIIPSETNEFGMQYQEQIDGEWVDTQLAAAP